MHRTPLEIEWLLNCRLYYLQILFLLHGGTSHSSETVLDVLGAIPLKSDVSNSHSTAAQLTLEHLKGIYAQVSQQAVMTAMTAGNQD